MTDRRGWWIHFLRRNLFPFFLESIRAFFLTSRYLSLVNEFRVDARCSRVGRGISEPRRYDEVQFHKTRKCWYSANKLLVWLTFSVNAVWMLATSCKLDRVTRLLLSRLDVYGRDGTSLKSIDIASVSYKYRLNQKFVHKFV